MVAQELQAVRLGMLSDTQDQLADHLERAAVALDQLVELVGWALDRPASFLRSTPQPPGGPCGQAHLFAVPSTPGGRVRPKRAGW